MHDPISLQEENKSILSLHSNINNPDLQATESGTFLHDPSVHFNKVGLK